MKFALLLTVVISLNLLAQDKEKIISGQENILSSELVKVGSCVDNSLELMADLSRHAGGDYTFITAESKLQLTLNEEVEIYDLKKTKKEGQKTEEKINVKVVDREGVVRTKSFSRYISTSYSNGDRKDVALLIAEVTTTALALRNECEAARRQYQDSLK